jgi:hypothetical protein
MSDSEIYDKEAIAASESSSASVGRNPGKKNKKLIIFLIIVLVLLIPIGGIMALSYVNKTSAPAVTYP